MRVSVVLLNIIVGVIRIRSSNQLNFVGCRCLCHALSASHVSRVITSVNPANAQLNVTQ